MLSLILLMGLLGIGVELLLLGHTEGAYQKIPLILIGVSLLGFVLHGILRRGLTVRLLQSLMLLLVLSGFVGTYLHYDGNKEFELEMTPAISGWKLFKESMTGATPTLAPGALIQLGLLGLVCTYRHPCLNEKQELK